MHELSLCRAIADTALHHAEGRPVQRVLVRIGHFRQVVPATLQHCWDMRVTGGVLDGAVLDVEHVPAVASCRTCGADTTLTVPVLRCGSCDGIDVVLRSGEEFLVVSIDVASSPATPSAEVVEDVSVGTDAPLARPTGGAPPER